MPVLRMPGDDTLGSTLGSMADAWGQAYDPLARARAMQMGQQMQLSQFELGKNKAIDAMNANAAQVYLNANPLGEDAASLAATAAAIRSGNYNPEQWVNATTGLAKLNANRKAAGALTADSPDAAGMTPGQIASGQAQLIAGNSLPTFQSQVAGATTDIAKTAATLDASNAARNATPATMSDLARSLAAAQAFTSPKEALITAAGGNVLSGANATTPADLATTRANSEIFTGQPMAVGTPVNQGDVANVRAQDTASRALIEATGSAFRAKPANEESAGAVINPGNVNAPVQIIQPGQAMPTPQAGDVAIPPRLINPDTVQTVAAAEEGGKEGAAATAKNNNTVINEAQAGGWRAQQLDAKVQQMRELLPYLNNNNPLQQVAGALAEHIQQEWGVTVGQGQSARNVYNVLVNQLLPEMKDDYGFQRVAAPEIALAQSGQPMSALDAASLVRLINKLDAASQINKRVAQLAGQARSAGGVGGVTPQGYNSFIQQREALNPMDFLNQVRQKYPEAPLTGGNAPPPTPSGKTRVWDSTTNKWIWE